MRVNLISLSPRLPSSRPRAVALRRTAVGVALSGVALALSGCYITPIHPYNAQSTLVIAPAAPVPLTFTTRLYPANEQAAPYGQIMAVVTNNLYGHGSFSTNIGGESFSGEATRVTGPNREGIASGTGSRGSFINCRYVMNSQTQGTGSCTLSNGAQFTMHVGN